MSSSTIPAAGQRMRRIRSYTVGRLIGGRAARGLVLRRHGGRLPPLGGISPISLRLVMIINAGIPAPNQGRPTMAAFAWSAPKSGQRRRHALGAAQHQAHQHKVRLRGRGLRRLAPCTWTATPSLLHRCRWSRRVGPTIEGCPPTYPLQRRGCRQVPQCGYCQSGQIMQAATLSPATSRPRATRSSSTWTAICAVAPITDHQLHPARPAGLTNAPQRARFLKGTAGCHPRPRFPSFRSTSPRRLPLARRRSRRAFGSPSRPMAPSRSSRRLPRWGRARSRPCR